MGPSPPTRAPFAVIVINANDNSGMVSRIVDAIAREYRWPEYPAFNPPNHPVTHVAENELIAYTGRYEFANNRMLTIGADRGHLLRVSSGIGPAPSHPPQAAVPAVTK
jgi:hypothetical protein